MQEKHPLHRWQPVTMSLRVCVSRMQQVDPLTIVQELEKSCAATQVSVSTLPSLKSHESYFEIVCMA